MTPCRKPFAAFRVAVVLTAVAALAPAVRAATIPIRWLDMSPGGTVTNGGVYPVPGLGNVTVTYSVPSNWQVSRFDDSDFDGSVNFGGDVYPWTGFQYVGTYYEGAVPLGPVSGTITFTFPSLMPAGSVLVGALGLGATTSFGGGTSTTTVAQNGTYLGEFVGDPTAGATQFNGGIGTFSLQNSVTAPSGLNPNWNTNLGVVRIDDPVSSLTVTQDQLRGDGVGVNVGFLREAPIGDHFTCYQTSRSKDAPQFTPFAGVDLVDPFGSSVVDIPKPRTLCAPTNKNGEDPTAPAHAEHLRGYNTKPHEKAALPSNVLVTNQFGSVRLAVKKATHLLVRSVKSLTPPTPPLPGSFTTDHFQCYGVSVVKGTPKFAPIPGVTLEDQFGPSTVTVKKPVALCAPVDTNNEGSGAETHETHLLCYQIQPDAKFPAVTGVLTNNQYAAEASTVKKPVQLCVPSLKNL